MSINADDIRAAVQAGMINERQAASLTALADLRRGARENMDGLDEPFELFKGFNEVFIVVGLTILYAGWSAVTGISIFTSSEPSIASSVFALIALAILALLSRYFTISRRMVAPSIALVVMTTLSAIHLGMSLAAGGELEQNVSLALVAGLTTIVLGLHYALFRVPFTMAVIALSVFTTAGAFFLIGGAETPDFIDFFKLSNNGPFAWLTIVIGLIGLGIALRLDMSDPHRVTRRSSSAFWLHVVAAPAITNTVAVTLLETDSGTSQLILLAFLALMAMFAIVIDRRSFLISGVGYVVTLAIIVLEGGASWAILLLGAGLVFLGAFWERMRGGLMHALPAFPGKGNLPPWDRPDTADRSRGAM